MLKFLTKFRLATRIYSGFLLLGMFSVLICFIGMFAVNDIHSSFSESSKLAENSGQVTKIETDLVALNQGLFFFSKNKTETDRDNVSDLFDKFDDHVLEIKESLSHLSSGQQSAEMIGSIAIEYKQKLDELIALFDENTKAATNINKYLSKTNERLNSMIENATLPSASMILNNLSNQLEAVEKELNQEKDQKKLFSLLTELKKSANNAKSAEMINTKKLRQVAESINALDDEIHRKINISKSFSEKNLKLIQLNESTTKKLQVILAELNSLSIEKINKSEVKKIGLQKIFVILAGISGLLSVCIAFLSLFGFRYPLARLIENASEISKGNRSVLIHYTERADEIGTLARSLSSVLAKVKELPLLSNDVLLGRPSNYVPSTAVSYVPIGSSEAIDSKTGDDIAYFGQGVGVDTESQLCQMLGVIQQISTSANSMANEMNGQFDQCKTQLVNMAETLQYVHGQLDSLNKKIPDFSLDAVKKNAKNIFDCLQNLQNISESLIQSCQTTVQEASFAQNTVQSTTEFISYLYEWIKTSMELAVDLQKTVSETKIMALNASIEAAKSSSQARVFNDIVLEIRQQCIKSEAQSSAIIDRLKTVQQGSINFANVLDNAKKETAANIEYSNTLSQTASTQNQQLSTTATFLNQLANNLEDIQKTLNEIVPNLTELPAHLQDGENIIPFMEREISLITKRFDEYVAILPTYEEETDPMNI